MQSSASQPLSLNFLFHVMGAINQATGWDCILKTANLDKIFFSNLCHFKDLKLPFLCTLEYSSLFLRSSPREYRRNPIGLINTQRNICPKLLCKQKDLVMGWGVGLANKGAYHKVWWPEFIPGLHMIEGRSNSQKWSSDLSICSMSHEQSIWTWTYVCTWIHTHILHKYM